MKTLQRITLSPDVSFMTFIAKVMVVVLPLKLLKNVFNSNPKRKRESTTRFKFNNPEYWKFSEMEIAH